LSHNRKDYNRHVNTTKHILNCSENDIEIVPIAIPNPTSSIMHNLFVCNCCNKAYKTKSGLWKHKSKCINANNENVKDNSNNSQLSSTVIIDFIKQNNELKEMLFEQNKKIMELSQSHTIVNNNSNNNNNQFNLNFFLHEKCKNAINLVDFVENLKITFDDLENVGNKGYVNGITDIFMKGLRELDLYTRPVHCTDIKRETLYIREQNQWIKEDPDLLKIKDAIKKIAFKNIQQISAWNESHPEMQILDSEDFKLSFNIMQESLGGPLGTDVDKNNDKIVKNIAKTVYIDKQTL
jgi:hypothetical protein